MNVCPSLMLHENVVQLSSFCHSAPISNSLLSTTHFVLTHSPQHLFGIGFSSKPYGWQKHLMRFSAHKGDGNRQTHWLTDNVTHFTLRFNHRISICVERTHSFHASIIRGPCFINFPQNLLPTNCCDTIVGRWTWTTTNDCERQFNQFPSTCETPSKLTTFVCVAADFVVGCFCSLQRVKGFAASRRLRRTQRLIANKSRHRTASRRVNYLPKAGLRRCKVLQRLTIGFRNAICAEDKVVLESLTFIFQMFSSHRK